MRITIASLLLSLAVITGIRVIAPPAVQAQNRALKIQIAEEATVHGDTVNLGQIAVFQPDYDPRVAELQSMQIASAPAPGNTLRFNRQFLDYKVGSAIADHGGDITLNTPDNLLIRRTAQIVTRERMEEIFRDHIMKNASWPEDTITLETVRASEDLALPEGSLHWDIRENGNTDYLGNVSATLTFFVDGQPVRKVPLSARVTVSRDVLQAVRNLQKGDLIEPKDVALVRQTSIRRQGDMLMDPSEVVGMRASRSLRAGTHLTAAMVEDPPVVEKGSTVIILAENDILRITARGEALESGRQGDRIRVRNLSSGKEFYSTVQAPGWVHVPF